MGSKSECVQVHFCYISIDTEVEKRVRTYASTSTAKRQITRWLNSSNNNFCRSYQYSNENWYVHNLNKKGCS